MRRALIIAVAITAPAGLYAAKREQSAAPSARRLTPAEINELSAIAPGAGTSGIRTISMVVLDGDPSSAGPYTIMLRVPPKTQIESHTHRDARSAVVVSGTWNFAYGRTSRSASFKALGPGSFYLEPAGVAHSARTGADGATVYITGWGPSDTRYIDRPNP